MRAVRSGHPWVYDDSVASTNHPGAPGDLAVVFDANDSFAAVGLWDPTSPIRLRILHHGDSLRIDRAFLDRTLTAARDKRSMLVDDGQTTGYRVCNAASDGLAGVVIDRYADTAVLRLDTVAWMAHLDALVEAVVSTLTVERVVLRLSRIVSAAWAEVGKPPDFEHVVDGSVMHGPPIDRPVVFTEAGVAFGADVVAGQKTGHFLDQRENRLIVAGAARGADVLDLCCATGGFTVHAAAAGARSVHSVDLAAAAIASTRDNLGRNGDRTARCRTTQDIGDVFDVVDRLRKQRHVFDIVIIDPPSFAPRRSAVDRAMGAYRRLTLLGLGVVRPGGLLVQSSCSSRIDADQFHAGVLAAAGTSGRHVLEDRRTGHPMDHPATFPEARYLKTTFLRVLS